MTRRREPPIDWAQIVCDLEAAGLTQRAIGESCDMDQPWANRLKNIHGTEPKFHNGALLLGLWTQTMGRPTNEVPRDGVRSSHAESH